MCKLNVSVVSSPTGATIGGRLQIPLFVSPLNLVY